MPSVAEIVDILEAFAPRRLAADWDNVGLLLGDERSRVERLLTCLTITTEVVAEALRESVQMIVTHHPVLFRGVKSLSSHTAEGRLLWPLASAGIAVYSPHTAFDNTVGGINDSLAQLLGLRNLQPLRRHSAVPQMKIVVYVPEADLERVAQAMFENGAGVIGQYSHCSFRSLGTGTFLGNENTNPTVGIKGQLEKVTEQRLEVVCPEPQLAAVLQALRAAHSYEEPAYDVYQLHAQPAATGEGRLGELPTSSSLGEFAKQVKIGLRAGGVQVVGAYDREVRRVAVACGAAGEFLHDATKAKADVFLTGEMRFHDYLAAQAQGIALVLPGHYATERPAVELLATRLATAFPTLQVWPSAGDADPVTWL